jgi:formate hydrogenlyase subunit 3/multisubunit Na+/H+ antiporter MnhD subunit
LLEQRRGLRGIDDFGGLMKRKPLICGWMSVAMFSLLGLPGLNGSISEFLIFRSLFEADYLVVLIVVMLLLTMIIWAFGKNIFKLLFSPAVDFKEDAIERINPAESISQFILLALVVYLGLNPPHQFVTLIQEAIKNLPH